MAEKHNEELLKTLVKGEPQVISTSASNITVSVRDKDKVEHEYVNSDATASGVIAARPFADLGIKPKPADKQKVFEAIEEVKAEYTTEEVEVELGLPNLRFAKFKIKRAPNKITKVYKSKET